MRQVAVDLAHKTSTSVAPDSSSVGRLITYDRPPTSTVAVIITCYNHAEFLSSAIESALGQTVAPTEIVLVDDGSTDQTAQVAQSYRGVRYVYQPNQGLSSARNTGIRNSTAEYLIFLDADDRLTKTAVESGLACFAGNPEAALVFGDFSRIDRAGKPLPAHNSRPHSSDHLAKSLLVWNIVGMHATVMYRRKVFGTLGQFDTRLRAAEDYDMLLRAALRLRLASHDEVVAEYRQHGANMSRDSALMLSNGLRVLRQIQRSVTLSPDQAQTLRDGVSYLKQEYGTRIWVELRHELRARRIKRSWLRRFLFLARTSPGVVFGEVHGFIAHNLGRRVYWLGRNKEKQLHHLRKLAALSSHSRRTISEVFGFDRGTPVDRYFIQSFLGRERELIRGHVLEIKDNMYTRAFGDDRVTQSDVLHPSPDWPGATMHNNLTHTESFPANRFDCIILTQTLHLIYDVRSVLNTLRRGLKPGGTLLLTTPGISQIFHSSLDEQKLKLDSDSWRFTRWSLNRLLREHFPEADLQVEALGNPCAITAFLYGAAVEDIPLDFLRWNDPDYELLVCAKVTNVKSGVRRH